MELSFTAVSETTPGGEWQSQFERCWPAYRQWYLEHRKDDAPDAAESRAALGRHMPELLPTYDRLVVLAGNDDTAARLLSCYCPPPYLVSCSQAALRRDSGNVLVRNYDLHPHLNEGLIMHSRWGEREVIATSEFLWGVADGMNDSGLAVSLAFGGSRTVGHGFGIVLILRYALETCDTVDQAVAVLRRIPCHMAYNVTLLDRRGDALTVQLGPERPLTIVEPAMATNHQGVPEDPAVATFNRTLERASRLRTLIDDRDTTTERLENAFLEAPLYNTRYEEGFGTLYTTVYRPEEGRVEHRWPGERWVQRFGEFRPGVRLVRYTAAGASVVAAPSAVVDPIRPSAGQTHWQAEVHACLRSLDAWVPAWLINEFAAAAQERRQPFG